LREVPEMTAFAQNKANYRAFHRLKDGHQGPQAPFGWREGTGEATSDWGWLTCCQEEDAVEGGAGLTIGRDGERYMVLVLRGGSGRSLLGRRNNSPVHNTSYVNPRPWRIAPGARSHNDVTQ